MSDKIDEPLDMLSIFVLMAPQTRFVLDCAVYAGRQFNVARATAECESRQKNRPRGSTKYVTAFDVPMRLKLLTVLGVLERDSDGYKVTNAAVERMLTSLDNGCTDAEVAAAPGWLQRLLALREVCGE